VAVHKATPCTFASRRISVLSLLRELSGSWRRGADIAHVSKPRIRRAKPRSQPSIQSHLFQPHHMLVSLRNSSVKAEEYQATPAPARIYPLIKSGTEPRLTIAKFLPLPRPPCLPYSPRRHVQALPCEPWSKTTGGSDKTPPAQATEAKPFEPWLKSCWMKRVGPLSQIWKAPTQSYVSRFWTS